MSVGAVFLILAALTFLAAALGATFIPNLIAVGLMFLALGILLSGVPIAWKGP